MRSGTSIMLLLLLTAQVAGCNDPSRPGPNDELPSSPVESASSAEDLRAAASASDTMVDGIEMLRRAGWIGGDLDTLHPAVGIHGEPALSLLFTRQSENAAVELLFYTDADSGETRTLTRPVDAASSALLARSMDQLDIPSIAPPGSPSSDTSRGILAALDPTTGGPRAAAVAGPSQCGYLFANQGLNPGQSLWSCNGAYRMTMQPDGNLVVYVGSSNSKVVWASGTWGRTPLYTIMQPDGNLVTYFTSGGPWSPNTWGHPGAFFRLQDDANLIVYSSSGGVLWSPNTWCESGCIGACQDWSCHYVGERGTSIACVNDSNPLGLYRINYTRQGRTDPASCQALYSDAFSGTVSCPNPNRLLTVFSCE